MQFQRVGISSFTKFPAIFFLGLLHATPGVANPVPADELSLQNGALYYENFCAECHGIAPDDDSSEWYETNEYDVEYDFTDLINPVEVEVEETVDEDWPDWAEIPDPGTKANDADVRREIMEELLAEIDKEYGEEEQSALLVEEEDDSGDQAYLDSAYTQENDESGRLPGSTDLTNPEAFFSGTSEEDIYDSIANGTGTEMKGWLAELETEEAVWDLVNYIRSFWGEEWH